MTKSLLDDHVIYFQTGTLFRSKQNASHHYTAKTGIPWPCPWCTWIYGHLRHSWSLPVQDPGDGLEELWANNNDSTKHTKNIGDYHF